MEISDRGLLYPILGFALVTAITAMDLFLSGAMPGAIMIANLYLVGVGAGLVVARIGRLGPFNGVLGSPWRESEIQDAINRETARALRYDRDLTVVAIRATDKSTLVFRRPIRATDQLFGCRNGWRLVILPETDRNSARLLIRQVCGNIPVQAAIVSPNGEHQRQRLETELIEHIRNAAHPGVISTDIRDSREAHVAAR